MRAVQTVGTCRRLFGGLGGIRLIASPRPPLGERLRAGRPETFGDPLPFRNRAFVERRMEYERLRAILAELNRDLVFRLIFLHETHAPHGLIEDAPEFLRGVAAL